jgi:hypothetical protein
MVEGTVSDTRFKLQEAVYFLNQMKSNIDNRTHFIFNLIAFVAAGRSVTFVMQSEFTRKVGPFAKWYSKNVDEVLSKEEVPQFFRKLRNIVLKKEGNPMQTIFLLVSSTLRLKYDIVGSTTRKEEEEEEVNSERESQQEQKTTITDNPAPPDPTLKYVWDILDLKDKTKKSKR